MPQMDCTVYVGNSAPRNSVLLPSTKAEADAAGPLGRIIDNPEGGKPSYGVITKQEVPDLERSVTKFVIPGGYSIVDAVKDITLAFYAQHSDEPAPWLHCDNDMVAELAAHELGIRGNAEVDIADVAMFGNVLEGDWNPKLEKLWASGVPLNNIQAIGRDVWAQALGDLTGDTGTTTSAPTATTITNTGKAYTTNQWYGHDVVIGGVIGTCLSNTGTVVTVARWETPGTRGGAVASTPSTGVYHIVSGQAPALWVALTANATATSVGGADTTLTGEIVTAGGALVRTVAVYAHTAGTNTYTLTITFTANGTDTLPVTVAKIGVFQSQNGGRLLFESLLNATATYSLSGDAAQITDTVTGT